MAALSRELGPGCWGYLKGGSGGGRTDLQIRAYPAPE
jgi:hypothetical protein